MAQKRKAKEAFGGQVSAFAAARKAKTQPLPEEAPQETLAAAIAESPYDGLPEIEDADASDGILPARPDIKLSNVERKNVKQIQNGIEVSLGVDQSITCVGEFDIQVLSGVVSIYGAMLHAASGSQRVWALGSNALPSIIGKKVDTRIRVTSTRRGIQVLEKYSPLFRSLGSGNNDASFNLLRTTADDTLCRSLMPLEVDEDTRKVLSRINARLEAGESPRVMAVGPKSTGKSTLNRLLCNMIITRPGGGKCYYLDLDPGQPEFAPPGQVSLVEVTAPLLGPSYTHFAITTSTCYRLIRSHTIAAVSFKDDPEHYVNCAIDLCRHVARDVPVVINTCGWVTGLAATALLDLLPHVRPTESIILGTVDSDLADALKNTSIIHPLPRRQLRSLSSRTPAELRAMHTMAYFHHSHGAGGAPEWTGEPICEFRPWMVSYEPNKPGIAAVLSYGQSPNPDLLTEVLDGALVAMVVPDLINPEAVEHTQKEDLPYIVDRSTGCSPPLDPSQSRLVGLALIRGIDETEKRIHLVTPLPDYEVAALLDRQIVLVRGAFDSPEWSYLEDLHFGESRGTKDDTFIAENDDRSWVSKRETHVGVEGAVWRLRHPPMKDAVR